MRYAPKLKAAPDTKKWHDWFAWWPVVTKDGIYVWCETIERRSYKDPEMIFTPFGYTWIDRWEYRVKP